MDKKTFIRQYVLNMLTVDTNRRLFSHSLSDDPENVNGGFVIKKTKALYAEAEIAWSVIVEEELKYQQDKVRDE